jgi:hypothetical protein
MLFHLWILYLGSSDHRVGFEPFIARKSVSCHLDNLPGLRKPVQILVHVHKYASHLTADVMYSRICFRTICCHLVRRPWRAPVLRLSRQTGTRPECINAPPPMGWGSQSPRTSLSMFSVSDRYSSQHVYSWNVFATCLLFCWAYMSYICCSLCVVQLSLWVTLLVNLRKHW